MAHAVQGRGSSAGTSLPALMAAWVLEGVPRAEWSRALGSAPSVPLAARLSALFVAYAAPQVGLALPGLSGLCAMQCGSCWCACCCARARASMGIGLIAE